MAAVPPLHRMGPPMPLAPPALWALGCLSLLLWLWVLCTACHRKRAPRWRARQRGGTKPVETSLLRQTHLCTLSKSDSKLQELHRGPRSSNTAPRPASMDLLRPQRLEVPRGSPLLKVAPTTFPPQQPPGAPSAATAPSTSPEATYSNVGLAAIPRASLAASPLVWAGTQLTTGWARPVVAEYACIQRLKGTGQGPQELQQGKATVTPAAQVDTLYSKVCKPKGRAPGPTTLQQGPKAGGTVPTLSLRGLGKDSSSLENVYESIREVGT